MPIMRDCKFYKVLANDCTALKELYCAKEEKPCSFYKPKGKEKKENEKNKAQKRL